MLAFKSAGVEDETGLERLVVARIESGERAPVHSQLGGMFG